MNILSDAQRDLMLARLAEAGIATDQSMLQRTTAAVAVAGSARDTTGYEETTPYF